jgi:hypothetical protein
VNDDPLWAIETLGKLDFVLEDGKGIAQDGSHCRGGGE